MTAEKLPTAMDQQIFKMGLSVETISVYLLCCALEDSGARISSSNLRAKWNGGEDALQAGIRRLEARNIIRPVVSDRQGTEVYRLLASGHWAA